MRIIAGTAGGIRLQVPGAVARPTSDRVREALFSILGARIDGARVLDLFAGSGALGLEALSRGATNALFVDSDRSACNVIRANLDKARLAENAAVYSRGVEQFLSGTADRMFDIVFADPPYWKRNGDMDFAADLMAGEDLRRVISAQGMVVLETGKGHGKTVPADGWKLIDSRKYGDTELSFFQLEAVAAE